MKKILFLILLLSINSFGQKSEMKITKQFIEAFNTRNLDAMMNLATDDVKWFKLAGDKLTTETSDKASLRNFMEGYFKSCPTCKSKITNLNQNRTRVTMTETASWETAKGKQSSDSFAVYEFMSGKIARVYYYGEPAKSNYDEALAKKLGADERGMKTFVFVNLIRGKAKFEKESASSAQHLLALAFHTGKCRSSVARAGSSSAPPIVSCCTANANKTRAKS